MDRFLTKVRTGERHLRRIDPRLDRLIAELGPCDFRAYRQPPFRSLLRAVISQQLSGKAAAAIESRLSALLPGDDAALPAAIDRLTEEHMRAAGLSRAKVRTLRGLSGFVLENPQEFENLRHLADDQVRQKICHIPGIGPWTAEMFLMFGLQRLDVFSGGDLGLRKAVQKVYQRDQRPSPQECVTLSERWKPYRTVAAWHLWRVVD